MTSSMPKCRSVTKAWPNWMSRSPHWDCKSHPYQKRRCFCAGKAFRKYRARAGTKTGVLSRFLHRRACGRRGMATSDARSHTRQKPLPDGRTDRALGAICGGRRSKLGRPSGIVRKFCLSMVKIAMRGTPYNDGSSSVPAFRMTNGRPGRRVARWVPQSAQNSRVTAFSISVHVNCFGAPLVSESRRAASA